MPNPTLPQPQKRSRLVWIIASVVVLFFFLLGGLFVYQMLFRNYAKEVAEPLERGLVEGGASIIRSGGDTGRSIDNREPWYDVSFRIALGKDEAEELIYKITKANGFKLTHASPENKGHLGTVVDNLYIDKWYFDITSKQNIFPDLEDGPVKLAVQLDHEGLAETGIRIEVRLPRYKP